MRPYSSLQGKHQGQCREGFFATGKQVYGTVFLTRRLSKNLQAGVQYFITQQRQARLPATKKSDEQLVKMLVG